MFAREAGRRALELQQRLTSVSSKDGGEFTASSIVTEADQEIGALAESFFGRLFPGCAVIQEETVEQFDPSVLTDQTLVFVVDPIDGTLLNHNRTVPIVPIRNVPML
jgi:fructose-1,6-bisphosphatase/inositol monophosphatase family enzyme